MSRRLDVWLNGTSLRSIGSKVLLQQVTEQQAQQQQTLLAIPGQDGQRLGSRSRQALTVTLDIAFRELYDLPTRANLVDAVNAWAQDGILEVSHRPGQRLRVICTKRAALGTVRDYTATTQIELTAYRVPFWEDTVPATLTMATGTSGNGTLAVGGSTAAPAEVTVTAQAALNTITLNVGSTTMTFTGLSIAKGGVLTVAQDERGILTVKNGTASKLGCLTPTSNDLLMASPGANSVSYTASAACAVSVSARARHL